MSGHTPGPWVAMNGKDVFTGLGALNAHGIETANSDGWYIADCSMGESYLGSGERAGLEWAEQKANARLIAAAPELLEALVAVLDYCVDDEGQPTIATARAAIAKATGGQP